MPRKETSRREWYRLAITVILCAVLAACTPDGQAQEIKPAATQSSDGLALNTEVGLQEGEEIIVETATPEATATETQTATPEATSTITATATPEKTEAENMHEYCIQRAKEVGIDLENLAESNNLWLIEHQGLAELWGAFDTSFSDDRTFKTMIVVGLDSLNSRARYDQAPTTAANKKIITWIEAVYKDASGQYQMVLLPTNIWDIENEIMWNKQSIFGGPQYFSDVNSKHMFNDIINNYSAPFYNPDFDFAASFVGNLAKQNYWLGPGAFISFDSDYPDFESAGGAGTLEEPNFSEEQLTEFRNTGNTDFFPYFMIDSKTGIKTPVVYPFINYGTLSKTDNYQEQTFIEEFVSWFTGDNSQWLNPDGPPYPRHWQPLP